MSYIDSANAPEVNNGLIKIHSKNDFDGMRVAGRIASNTLDMIADHVKPGVKTVELDNICRKYIEDEGAIPAPLNYRGFPKSICTSVNHVVCHGIPGEKILESGDILNIDVTVIYNGWHGDTSRMFFVGDVSIKAKKLSDITYESMMRGIEIIKPGITTGDIGHAIQTYAESKKYSVVRDFCGHGIGKVFHDAPNILHYGLPDSGIQLKEGMFFTVEPMINIGKWQIKMLNDGWTAVTRDKSLSAQFEHSVGVTSNGFEIFTESSKKKHKPPF
ncbi:MAG: Methionine aminopeptidase [Alphaproteobacteria bacterium MarineAlpha2_Bin1]|nr:MAG: Methionine aminopeptidase [Alphaproteobacteria bacterium MarineAlpha2_Bin1]|tara:strand:+ start:107 stop:925 length:819 start_codon:yes stop_codon:yes gene_type:complete